MDGYKIVYVTTSGLLVGISAKKFHTARLEQFIAVYTPGEFTLPPVDGSKLFAYSTTFGVPDYDLADGYELWECDFTNPIRFANKRITNYQRAADLWPLSAREYGGTSAIVTPLATVLCDAIKLLKKVK